MSNFQYFNCVNWLDLLAMTSIRAESGGFDSCQLLLTKETKSAIKQYL